MDSFPKVPFTDPVVSSPQLLEVPLALGCLLLSMVVVHCLAVAHCLLPSRLASLASSECISSSLVLVPVVAGRALGVLGLMMSVLESGFGGRAFFLTLNHVSPFHAV